VRLLRSLNSLSLTHAFCTQSQLVLYHYHTSPRAQSHDVQSAARFVLRRARAALYAIAGGSHNTYGALYLIYMYIRRAAHGATKNTACAVYPTWGLEQLNRLKQSLATRP